MLGVTAVVVGIGAAVIGGISSHRASEDASQAQSQNLEAQFAYDSEKYAIQSRYRRELLGYKREQENYADKQLDFAYQQIDYAREQYNVGLKNIAEENNFKQEEVYNTKLAAATEYNAQKDTADIMKYGAADALNRTIEETLRTQGANKAELNRQAGKAMGDVQATRSSGIMAGASIDRDKIAVFMEKNRAMSQLDEQTATSIIQASASRDEMVSGYAMKTEEAYRLLTATLRLDAAPTANIPGPQPIFAEKQPIGPVTPLDPKPIKGVIADSGWSSLAAGMGGASAGFNLGTNVYNAVK